MSLQGLLPYAWSYPTSCWANTPQPISTLRSGSSYGFGETRVALVALLTFTVPAGSIAGGVVTTKFSGHAVSFRSSPTLAAAQTSGPSIGPLHLRLHNT